MDTRAHGTEVDAFGARHLNLGGRALPSNSPAARVMASYLPSAHGRAGIRPASPGYGAVTVAVAGLLRERYLHKYTPRVLIAPLLLQSSGTQVLAPASPLPSGYACPRCALRARHSCSYCARSGRRGHIHAVGHIPGQRFPLRVHPRGHLGPHPRTRVRLHAAPPLPTPVFSVAADRRRPLRSPRSSHLRLRAMVTGYGNS